jgi:predicted Zn-dependent peptidase
VSAVRQVTLANGLRVVAIEMPQVKHVAIRVFIGAGSRDDPRDKAGICHFVEHLLFRGNERYSHEGALRAHIASMGGRANAQTGKEWKSLDLDVSARHLRSALSVMADMLLTPNFNGIEVERRIVLEELASVYDENDGTIWGLEELTEKILWPYSTLGVPILGEARTVLDISLADVQHYMARHYLAGNMVLAIAGCVRLEEILKDVERLFGALRAGISYRSRTAPALTAGASHLLEQHGSPRAATRLLFPTTGWGGPMEAPALLMSLVLAAHGAGRIHDTLRSRAGLSYSGEADAVLYSDAGRFTIDASTKKEKLPQLVTALARMLRDIRDRGPSPADLEAAKESWGLALEGISEAPAEAAVHVGIAVLEGRPLIDEHLAMARAVTGAQMAEFARATFRSKIGHLLVNGDRDEELLGAAWRAFETALAE